MTTEEHTLGLLAGRHTAPFLFIGSGFSLRHLGLEDWKNLLDKFASELKRPLNYYLSHADGDLPVVGSLLADDYNKFWWDSTSTAVQREKFQHLVTGKSDALKVAIAEYIQSKTPVDLKDLIKADEVESLKTATVDGIVTTNWDCLLERIFPEYKTYVGQSQLITAAPQGIAEIYKIHGCVTRPSSLVLTHEDYADYNAKNAYLAAKLITIFVEHPVFFVGYSLNDSNIKDLLASVVGCLDSEGLAKVKDNLIFVQRDKPGRVAGVSDTQFVFDKTVVPVKVLVTGDFTGVYKALGKVHRKIPVKHLRVIKEQIYAIAKETEPKSKIAVLNLDDLQQDQLVEFVVGVGVASAHWGEKGYLAITTHDLFKLLIEDTDGRYNPKEILQLTIPQLVKSTPYVPYFVFLRKCDLSSRADCETAGQLIAAIADRPIDDFKSPNYRSQAEKLAIKSVEHVIQSYSPDKAAVLLPWIEWKPDDQSIVRGFLNANIGSFSAKGSKYSTHYRKLACLYDRRYFGWS